MTSKHTPLVVAVVTRSIAEPDKGIKRRRIDYRSTPDRKWLADHCYWAMNNGHSVTTSPVANTWVDCDNPHCPGH